MLGRRGAARAGRHAQGLHLWRAGGGQGDDGGGDGGVVGPVVRGAGGDGIETWARSTVGGRQADLDIIELICGNLQWRAGLLQDTKMKHQTLQLPTRSYYYIKHK